MHANLTSGKIKEGQIEKFISIYESSVKPVVTSIPGLVNLFVLTNKNKSEGLIIAIYGNQEDAEKAQKDGHFQQALGTLASTLVIESISRGSYDVSVHI